MFELHRIFCATPWELEAERILFYDLIAKFNETSAMPVGVLFVPVTLTNVRDKRPFQYTVDDNIRQCRHYLLVLSDGWGPVERNFRTDYDLALQCAADPALPMRQTAVLLKQQPSGSGLAEGLPVADATFHTPAEFGECLNNLLSAWLQSIPPETPAL